MKVETKNLSFYIDESARDAKFILNESPAAASEGSDFWRLILDDGQRTEIPVFSSKQKGIVERTDAGLRIIYSRLVSEYGDSYQIYLEVLVTEEDGLLRFRPYLENLESDVRVNECFCPLADFTQLYGEKEKDVLYMPNGLGTRAPNPWKVLEKMTGDYYAHNEYEIFWHLHYPRATMSWLGIESGKHFLYMARYDEQMRHCFLTVRQRIHSEPLNLTLGIDHFPMARPGEALTLPAGVVGVLDGDWRTAADRYRKWADKAFYRAPDKAKWVQEMTGWQRVIMRSQYGEDYYKAEDLPRLYEIGAKYGIHTLFLFGWWKGGMDRDYPTYEEPYPGAFEALRDNIRKVRRMGGRVILECNAHFMDPTNPYYKEFGREVEILDINGNEVRPAFGYPGHGEYRFTYGKKQFPLCCSGSERWRKKLLSVVKQMGELDPDCLFVDCFGACPYQPCFNDRHEHGPRVDEEWIGHRKFFDEAQEYCRQEGKVLAVEIVTDIAASYTQFIHGLINVDFRIDGSAFPQLFRYTFPEVITTDRGIRHEEGDFDRRLKSALVSGVRLDAELYVCRADLDRSPKYAAVAAYYTSVLEKYKEFMMLGTYTVIDTSPLPYYVKRGEYYDQARRRVLRILYNASDAPVTVCGRKLGGDEMVFDIFELEEYRGMTAAADDAGAAACGDGKKVCKRDASAGSQGAETAASVVLTQEAGVLPPDAS